MGPHKFGPNNITFELAFPMGWDSPVLEHPSLFLFFLFFWENDFVPGSPGTEVFVP